MALHVAADHRAVEDVLSAANSVVVPWALIVVRHGSGAALLQRQSGLCCGQARRIWLFSSSRQGRWRVRADRHRARRRRAICRPKRGSLDSLNWRIRCGCRPWARQMRWTELTLSPAALRHRGSGPVGRPPGGSPSVKATTRSAAAALSGLILEGRVLSRTRPSNPSSTKRSPPAPNAGLGLGRSPHDLVRADAIGGQHHDFSPPDVASAARCGLAPQL